MHITKLWSRQASCRQMTRRSTLVAKKQPAKRPSLEEILDLLRQRHRGRLAPFLEGFACRFTIWLPIQAQGKPVFTQKQRVLLADFFHECFGGFSQSAAEGFPPWSGSWLPEGADQPIVDQHIL